MFRYVCAPSYFFGLVNGGLTYFFSFHWFGWFQGSIFGLFSHVVRFAIQISMAMLWVYKFVILVGR